MNIDNDNCSKCINILKSNCDGKLENCICRKCPRNIEKCIITKYCSETESTLNI
ncbi:hypothetical protein NRP93_003100 [Clostridium botulinum]|nr:hypothetical protein [Clostridium botulinum]